MFILIGDLFIEDGLSLELRIGVNSFHANLRIYILRNTCNNVSNSQNADRTNKRLLEFQMPPSALVLLWLLKDVTIQLEHKSIGMKISAPNPNAVRSKFNIDCI
jgi:hypothetical protein